MENTSVEYRTISDLAGEIRSGRLGPVELTEHLLRRIERLDGALHAFVEVTGERALAEARAAEVLIRAGQDRGPLHGIPYVAKDLFDVKGLPTRAGA